MFVNNFNEEEKYYCFSMRSVKSNSEVVSKVGRLEPNYERDQYANCTK